MRGLVLIKTPDKIVVRGWLKGPEAREYSGGVDKRTYAMWKKMGLRTLRVNGVELTRPEWVDEFLMSHDQSARTTEQEARQMVRSLRAAPRRRQGA